MILFSNSSPQILQPCPSRTMGSLDEKGSESLQSHRFRKCKHMKNPGQEARRAMHASGLHESRAHKPKPRQAPIVNQSYSISIEGFAARATTHTWASKSVVASSMAQPRFRSRVIIISKAYEFCTRILHTYILTMLPAMN